MRLETSLKAVGPFLNRVGGATTCDWAGTNRERAPLTTIGIFSNCDLGTTNGDGAVNNCDGEHH